MTRPYFISAIGTPLDSDEHLDKQALEAHLEDQWSAGIDGVLVGGTMGLMQLLRDSTYRDLAQQAAKLGRGRGEVLIGAGDTGLARTQEKIEFLNALPIDGIVVLTPYFFPFPQGMLVDYFLHLAEIAKKPLYLYDLPAVTGVGITIDTYAKLAKHPNIAGAKVSGRLDIGRQLLDYFGDQLRIILAEPQMVDVLLRAGIDQHLDGMFSVAPQWVKAIGDAAVNGDWVTAARYQQKLTTLRSLLTQYESDMGAFTAMLNMRGINGIYHTAPYYALSESERTAIRQSAVMQDLLAVNIAQ